MKKIFTFAAALLSASLLVAGNGMLAAGRGTPVLDGKLNDAAWQNSIAATPFLLQTENRFATEQTLARFLWDDTNFYVGFQCRERALEPLENKLHAFKRNLKTRDSDAIYKDDCVTLLLVNPAFPNRVFDLTVNAAGTISDCVSTPPDLWGTRDRSWDSQAQVAIELHTADRDGYWNVEIAIPWRALGGAAPQRNAKWKMLAARFEQNASEKSAFQNIKGGGIHTLANLSELKFVTQVPGITLQSLPAFTPGANTLTVGSTTAKPLELGGAIAFDGKPRRFRARIAAGAATGVLPFELDRSGAFVFHWSVTSGATLEEFFRSPDYRLLVSSSTLAARLTNATLTVNGRPASATTMLTSGANELVVTGGADAQAELTAGEFPIPFPAGWRHDEKRGVRQLKLLVEDSSIWPNWHTEGISIPRGSLQQILFRPQGFAGVPPVADYTMYFDLPEGFTSPGASGYYQLYALECKPVGPVRHLGKPYQRYAVKINQPLPFNKALKSHEYIAFFVMAPENFSADHTTLYYHAGSASQAICEVPNAVPVHVLPRLAGKLPKKLHTQLWLGWLNSLDNPELKKANMKLFTQSGFNETGLSGQPGLGRFVLIGFSSWNFPLTDYLTQHPGTAQCDRDGKRSPLYVCSTELVSNPDFAAFLRSRLKAWHVKWGTPSHINWDYEHRVLESYLACFCPRCLTAFGKHYRITEKLTPEIIKARYYPQWTEYMDRRMADMSQIFRDAIRAELPGVIFSVYTGYQSAETKHYYGVDWSMLDGRIDLAMCGYGRNLEELEATRKALPNTPLLLGAIAYPYRFEERTAPQFVSAARLLRRACDATAGVLIYEYATLDGRTFAAMSTVSQIMADHEELFLAGKRAGDTFKVRGFDRADYELITHQGQMLLALMNPNSVKRHYEFSAPVPLTDFFTGKTVSGVVKGTIEPHGIAVFVTNK